MTGRNQQVGPLPLPFPFKFYENSYDQVYISTNGTIGFSGKLTSQGQVYSFPQIQEPNNVIAANWAPEDASTGGVYYRSGGTAPNRWFAVEWHQVRDTNPDSRLTFEILLRESGNIEFLYQTVNYGADNSRYTPGVGIEDSRGRDGLYYNADYLRNNRAVYITRPAPSARVSLWPRSGQGALAPPQTAADCTWTVSNNGEFGTDRYDVAAASGWPTQVLGPDGVTPLADTDGDGVIDTGPLAMGASAEVHVMLSVPAGAQVGDHGSAVVMFRSAVDTARAPCDPDARRPWRPHLRRHTGWPRMRQRGRCASSTPRAAAR